MACDGDFFTNVSQVNTETPEWSISLLPPAQPYHKTPRPQMRQALINSRARVAQG